MGNTWIIISNCIYSIVDFFVFIFNNFNWLFILGIPCFLWICIPIWGFAFAICSTKKLKRSAIISFFIAMIPNIIIFVCILGLKLYESVDWSIKRIDIEKSNGILFRLYDENIDIIKEQYVAVELSEDSVIFKQYDRMVNEYLDERDFTGEIEIKVNEEEKKILKKAMRYDDVIIVKGNEIIYKKIIKNKNPEYCPKMYKVKYNRTQVYEEEYDRSFKDCDRKWCEEEYYIGEGKIPRAFW